MMNAVEQSADLAWRFEAQIENSEAPVEGDLWDLDRLQQHGVFLAENSGQPDEARRVDLKKILRANSRALASAYGAIVSALQAGRAITPAAQWIVDNHHVISDQLNDAPLRLTPALWRRLPAAGHPDAPGWPRVYHIATEYLRHTLWEFNPASLVRLLNGYQEAAPLRMDEIWALYPTLRIALLDELRLIAFRVETSLAARRAADELADALSREDRSDRPPGARDLPAWSYRKFSASFVVQLAHRLQGMGERGRPWLEALSRELERRGTNLDEYIQRQHTRRSASNVAARNIITSLRVLASIDWRLLFEKTSRVESLLREQPDYLACDSRTRDRYRGSIEDISRATGRHELEVTRQILALLASKPAADGAASTLGAWLIGPRRVGLEQALQAPLSPASRFKRAAIHHAKGLYLGGITALTVLLVTVLARFELDGGTVSWGMLAVLWLLAAFPASELVIGILNRLWLTAFPPRHLPCLALESGLTAEMKTLVVVPIVLRSEQDAAAACRQLQIHALANPDPRIRFALLSDWADSPSEFRHDDERILAAARAGIAALNAKTPQEADEPRFFLLHRRRQWVETERCYTGWDRKRGKLEELNRLLLDRGPTGFLPDRDGVLQVPRDIRYVLTVDADTRLPLGCVKDLVGTAMHPLNRPVVSATERRVVQGYGVLQPRITPLLPETGERSLYREIHTSGSGLDPYAAAVSDLHQDVFGEGLFTGKGLYDLATWETVLADRVPAESVLSHDLFEGLFARCGLVSQIELFEDFPSHSEVAAARSHRWMRGDWQLLPWLLGRRGPVPPLGRWKMFDNLRRSLIAPCSVALLVVAFAAGTSMAGMWLALVLAPSVWPALSTAMQRLFRTPIARSRRMHLYRLGADFAADLGRAAVSLALLAQNAWLALDAIGRALFRLAISRRHLLEWTTAAQLKAGRSGALSTFVWPMKSASIVVVSAVAVLMAANPSAIAQFAPLLLLWWLSPLVAQLLSRPMDMRAADAELPADVEAELRATARRTWTFFEEFVTAEDNHLPPDNFQEDPVAVVAHRSSPTNFGLYLLATVAARDFGWLGLQAMAARLSATLATLQRLERHQGHFLNWYETRTLAPLAPRYVSTVDSGNLAGHLLTLRQACLAFGSSPLLSPRALTGPVDAIACCLLELGQVQAGDAAGMRRREKLVGTLTLIRSRLGGRIVTLADGQETLQTAAQDIDRLLHDPAAWLPPPVMRWLQVARRDIDSHLRDLRELLPETLLAVLPHDVTLRQLGPCSPQCIALSALLEDLAAQCHALVEDMSFGFLFDRARGLFSIGYRLSDQELDEGHYDLLASEARLASLVAIARGDVPRSHWLRLGRRLTGGPRRPVLASWSGSMFEYLMPALVVHEPRYSLLEQTNRRVVRQQIRHGEAHRLPWGISESAYNVRDREYTYQYSGFGVPSLGLKRGLSADYVVAPYASALAAMYRPLEANDNLRALAQLDGRGGYGFYEALDFTASRVPEGKTVAVVRAYMAHHQGMSLVALDNVLQDHIMQSRFHADPGIAAADLLLQERRLRFVEAPVLAEVDVPASAAVEEMPDVARVVEGACTATPMTHLLSNRSYSVMLTDAGGGYSSCRGRAVTRWREDATRDNWGTFVYLHDVEQRRLWSAGLQPTAAVPDEYRVRFNEECVSFERRDGLLRTTMTVVVAPDDDGELRRVMVCNDGNHPRQVELTSCAEVVLAPQRADLAHPGFSNLFVQTEFHEETGALLAARRPRSSREAPVWAMHMLAGTGASPAHMQYETDRCRFLGRGGDYDRPLALQAGRALSNTVGNVLDPIFSLRTVVTVPPHGHVSVTFGTFMAATREQALALVAKYRPPGLFEHVLSSAWTFARAELYYLRSSLSEAMLFQSLASHLLMGTQQLRAAATPGGPLDVTHLWRFSISGDRPILLVRCHSQDDLLFVQQCLRAQEYLRVKHLAIDVVILNERRHSYVRDLQEAIEHTVRAFGGAATEGEDRGGIYALAADAMGEAEKRLLLSLARVALDPAQGSLMELLSRPPVTPSPSPAPPLREAMLALTGPDSGEHLPPDLAFFNGWGGFSPQGREYVISLPRSGTTPAPWSNVLANEQFGTLVTERGSMCTWSLNSRENQLTPWSNDAVRDPSGESFYLLAEDGELWSPAAQPVRHADAQYQVRHGQGYSRFDVTCRGLETQLTVFVTADDPVKICRLRIRNSLATPQRLVVASCVDWALGATRAGINHNVQTWSDRATNAHFAANPALIDFGTRVAFCDFGGRQQYGTDSRHEFLGRNGSPASPAGLRRIKGWSTGHGPGHDPCSAFALLLDLQPHATDELVFVLGQAADAEQARELVLKYRASDIEQAQRQVVERWDRMLGTIQIRTPDPALDLLFNRWLLYQTASCRFWGRAAFYQAGGAYGFRDQLQDGMTLAMAAPEQVRAHLLRAAARQFTEGDVQHWWHPPSGRGVRTHISDDLIWLPYTVHHYLQVTQDESVLDEKVPFIEGPPLPIHQEDAHYIPGVSATTASLYEHCARTLDRSLRTGAHGLPLIGGGDWNDGMNRVGHAGRGESVWLAWFLIATLQRFVPIAQSRRDHARAGRWLEHIELLAAACEREAWDGEWYRRAFFDDGTPLGSRRNEECRIDSIAQSWAVLCGAAEPERARAAMEAVRRHLVRDEQGLVLLFSPPFDVAPVDPGYIKGYLPGLRENGGQYTHAAIWVLMAQSVLGNQQQVGELLRMLNPIRRSESSETASVYRVEPYVLAADIYSCEGAEQRGGWTWYTGAAGWMYRAILEFVLGVRIEGEKLRIAPCVPAQWPGFEVRLQLPEIDYSVRMRRSAGPEPQLLFDGASVAGDVVPLLRDGRPHSVEILLPEA